MRIAEDRPTQIKITDIHGRVIKETEVKLTAPFLKTTFALDISTYQLKAGLYLITLESGETRITQKIIVQ